MTSRPPFTQQLDHLQQQAEWRAAIRRLRAKYATSSALDDAVHATGNGVTLDGISFSISNQSTLLAAARAQAMLSANTEASQVAAGAGLALGPIVKVTDNENSGQQVFFAPSAAAGSVNASVPVQPGQQQISVGVTVVYQLVATS